jgi:GTP-binding protein
MAVDVYARKNIKISTSELNNVFLPITETTPPPAYKGKYVKIKYITQIPTMVPSFAFFCNLPQYVKDPYKRFIENKLREMYELQGVPIRIYFRKK